MPGSTREADGGKHLDEDVCVDILAGLVTRPELDGILSHVRRCPSCEDRLIAAGGDWEMIRARAAQEGRLAPGTVPAPDPARPRSPARMLFRTSRWAVPALAAAAVIVVLARMPSEPVGSGDLTYWIPTTGETVKLRGAHGADADSAFWTGLAAYQDRDAATGITLLQGARTAGGMEDLRRLLLANLLVNAGRAEESLRLLQDLEIDTLPHPWREDASWIEFIALASLGRSGEAGERLAIMAEWPGRVGDLARARKAAEDR